MGLAKAKLIEKFGMNPDTVKGDYNMPIATVCFHKGRAVKPVPLLEWTEKNGWGVFCDGFATAGVQATPEEVMSALKES